MISRHLSGYLLMIIVVGMPSALLAETEVLPLASIELEKNVHFITPEGDNVLVAQGFYTLEAVEGGMRLIKGITPEEAGETFLIGARLSSYEKKVEEVQVRSTFLNEDTHYIALIRPEGQVLEAFGSYSGVRSRGFLQDLLRQVEEKKARSKEKSEELSEEEKELIARRDALLSARKSMEEERKRLAKEKEQAQKNPSAWKDYCSKRFPNHVNNHNNCCVQKYDSCLRGARTFKDSARRGFEQTCQALNKGCWLRRTTDNLDWMLKYCNSTENLKKIRVSSKNQCCSKMYDRCFKSSLSVPTVNRRLESQDRCKKAGEICQAGS